MYLKKANVFLLKATERLLAEAMEEGLEVMQGGTSPEEGVGIRKEVGVGNLGEFKGLRLHDRSG